MEMIANIFAFPINGFMYFFLLAYNYDQYITETNLIFRLEGCLSHVYILYGHLLWKYKILKDRNSWAPTYPAIARFASPFLAFDLFVLERFHQIGYTNPYQK